MSKTYIKELREVVKQARRYRQGETAGGQRRPQADRGPRFNDGQMTSRGPAKQDRPARMTIVIRACAPPVLAPSPSERSGLHGASQSAVSLSSSMLSVIEHPAISREVGCS